MTFKAVRKLIADCEAAGKIPEVTFGGIRFMIHIDDENMVQLTTLLDTTEDAFHPTKGLIWEEYSERISRRINPVPISTLTDRDKCACGKLVGGKEFLDNEKCDACITKELQESEDDDGGNSDSKETDS